MSFFEYSRICIEISVEYSINFVECRRSILECSVSVLEIHWNILEVPRTLFDYLQDIEVRWEYFTSDDIHWLKLDWFFYQNWKLMHFQEKKKWNWFILIETEINRFLTDEVEGVFRQNFKMIVLSTITDIEIFNQN